MCVNDHASFAFPACPSALSIANFSLPALPCSTRGSWGNWASVISPRGRNCGKWFRAFLFPSMRSRALSDGSAGAADRGGCWLDVVDGQAATHERTRRHCDRHGARRGAAAEEGQDGGWRGPDEIGRTLWRG